MKIQTKHTLSFQLIAFLYLHSSKRERTRRCSFENHKIILKHVSQILSIGDVCYYLVVKKTQFIA